MLTVNNKKAEWTDTRTHLELWTESDLEYYFNTALSDFQDKERWRDVNYVIGCINIKEHWLVVAADMRKGKIYMFDSMPKYVKKKLLMKLLKCLHDASPHSQLQLE